MVDGQKQNISLDSGLDAKSSDMLVPIDNPLFQHNRQKFQGHYMPSSLRFEHDGWAVGWDVYNFKFKYNDYRTKGGEFFVAKNYINNNPAYMFIFQDDTDPERKIDIAKVWWNTMSSAPADITVTSNDSVTNLYGYLNGKRYCITVDPVHNIQAIDNEDMDFTLTALANGSTKVYVIDRTAHYDFDVNLRSAGDIYNGDILFSRLLSIDGTQYNYDRGSYSERNGLTLDDKIKQYSVEDKILSSIFTTNYRLKLHGSFQFDTIYPLLDEIGLTYNTKTPKLLAQTDDAQTFDKFGVQYQIDDGDTILKPGNKIKLTGWVPLWRGLCVNLTRQESGAQILDSLHVDDEVKNDIRLSVDIVPDRGWKIYDRQVRKWSACLWEHNIKKQDMPCEVIQKPKLKAEFTVHVLDEDLDLSEYQWYGGGYEYEPGVYYREAGYEWESNGRNSGTYYPSGYYYGGNYRNPATSKYVPAGYYYHGQHFTPSGQYITSEYDEVTGWQGTEYGSGPVLTHHTVRYALYNVDTSASATVFTFDKVWDDADNIDISAWGNGHFDNDFELVITDREGVELPEGRYTIARHNIYVTGAHKLNINNTNTVTFDWSSGKLTSDGLSASTQLLPHGEAYYTGATDTSLYFTTWFKGYFAQEWGFSEILTDSRPLNKITCGPSEVDDIDTKYYVDRAGGIGHHFVDFEFGDFNADDEKIFIVISEHTDAEHPENVEFDAGSFNFYIHGMDMETYGVPTSFCPSMIYFNNTEEAASMSNSMSAVNKISFNIKFKPQKLQCIDTCALNFTLPEDDIVDHAFKKNAYPEWVSSLVAEIDPVFTTEKVIVNNEEVKVRRYRGEIQDTPNGKKYVVSQSIVIKVSDNILLNLTYDNTIDEMIVNQSSGDINGYHYAPADLNDENELPLKVDYIKLDFIFDIPLEYNLTAKLARVNSPIIIESAQDGIYICNYRGMSLVINAAEQLVTFLGKSFEMSQDDDVLTSTVSSDVEATYNAIIRGPYKTDNAQVLSFNNDSMLIDIDNRQYELDYAPLLELKDSIDYEYIDTTKEDIEPVTIEEVDPSTEFQFLKQQWETTTKVDNFWWIDSEHILVLDQSKFILRQKTDQLSDWDGDVFEDVAEWPKSIMPVNIYHYGATSAYKGDTALFYCVGQNGSKRLFITFMDPLNNMQKKTIYLSIGKHELGTKLNDNNRNLNTYTDLNASMILSSAKFSATCRDGCILFGIHYNDNMNQWAVNINRQTLSFFVLQGYGFVGIDGSLTGGQIPAKYFDISSGFNTKVLSLDVLKSDPVKIIKGTSAIYQIDVGEIVVGTESQQWYISEKIDSIVSHLIWQNDHWVQQYLPITNNLSQKYSSASCAVSLLSDIAPMRRSLQELLTGQMKEQSSLTKIVDAIGDALLAPPIWMLYPKMSFLFDLQQTLGQAAYVHRNTKTYRHLKDAHDENDIKNKNDMSDRVDTILEEKEHDKAINPILSDDLAFNVHEMPQSATVNGVYDSLINMIAVSQGILDGATFEKRAKINEAKNETKTNDKGVQNTSFYIKQIDMLCSTDMVALCAVPNISQSIAGALSLDMFFTNSDNQMISAGPGWVNHNFVAQCVSQSVTAHNLMCKQYGVMFIMKMFSKWEMAVKIVVTEKIVDGIEKSADATKEASAFGGINFGGLIAAGLYLANMALKAALWEMKWVHDNMDMLLDAMGGNHIGAKILYNTRTRTVDVEAKHNYGDKSECFMWPCFDTSSAQIPDETVQVVSENNPWKLNVEMLMNSGGRFSELVNKTTNGVNNALLGLTSIINNGVVDFKGSTTSEQDLDVRCIMHGDVKYYIANIQGSTRQRDLPEGMAYVIGAESILPKTPYRNENIGESAPAFATPPFQDYIIDRDWQIAHTASEGMTTWISCKDTKIIDGEMSNAVISDSFCGIASPYCAVEVKRGIQKKYLRPWAITADALALNHTGKNCCYDRKAYHAFDGYGYRVVSWMGSPGMNKEYRTWLYSFLVNDRFKRSNKLPPNEYLGNFNSYPVVATNGDDNDKVFTLITQPGTGKGTTSGTIGEDKDVHRYSLPIFSEPVQTLPATVKTQAAVMLSVIDGITTLTTNLREMQSAYKAPLSIDFAIGNKMYRYTNEYICTLEFDTGIAIVKEVVPCLGLNFVGTTPYEAYFYSPATRMYYTFSGGSSLSVVDTIERFRNVTTGHYDFVNQEVIMPCVATFNRIDKHVKDDEDETDNVIVPRIKDSQIIGEIWPPLDNIYNTRSWYRLLSLPSGIVYQGPNRCIINRFILQDYMVKQIKSNYGKWKRIPREKYNPFRKYAAKYEYVDQQIGGQLEVAGWTHNPFLLVTAPLGVGEETDCVFEWEITFCWPIEMDKLYGIDNYATVCMQAETMTPGGKVIAERPTHVYLTKDLFTRTGNYGYYSFRYQSKCGAGNRERLHIWSDQYICISSLQCEYKPTTQKRTEILTQHVDVQQLHEI